MITHVDNEHIWIGIDNGILFFTYKNGIVIDLPVAIGTVGQRLSVQNGKYYPIICDVNGVRYIDRSARIYLSKQGSLLVKALALVSDSRSTTAITQFYLSFNAGSIPVRMFKDKDAALWFLRSV